MAMMDGFFPSGANWHYALGLTFAQIRDTLDFHLRFPWSKGGMIRQWHALRRILLLWYETLIAEIRHSAVLHADDRMAGQGRDIGRISYTDTLHRRAPPGRAAGEIPG